MQRSIDTTIGRKEISAILFVMLITKISDSTPVLLFKRAKTSGWLLPLIAVIVITPSYFLMLKVLKKYNQNLIEILYRLMGKFMGFLYGFAVFLTPVFLMIIFTRDASEVIRTMFYIKTPNLVIYLLFISSAIFIASRGLCVVGSTCKLLLPLFIASIFLLLLLSIPDMQIGYIFPLNGIKPVEYITGLPFYSSLEIEVITVSILFPRVKSYKEYKLGSSFALYGSALLISISCLAFLLVFDEVPLEHIAIPFHELSRMIRVGRFVSHAEAIFFYFWIIASVLRIAVYLYISTELFCRLFHIKHLNPFLILLGSITLFLSLLPKNYIYLVLNARRYLLLYASLVLLPLPYILALLSAWKGDKNT